MLHEWTEKHPSLPFLFLGTLIQKHTILTIRADIVRFLVKPYRLDELVDAVDDLYINSRCRSAVSE